MTLSAENKPLDKQSFAKLIVHEGPIPGEEIELSLDEFVIGRDPQANLVIPSPAVSRRHARIYRQESQYLVEDLGSSNKTYLNDELVSSARILQSGDTLRLGGVIHFTFVCIAPAPSAQDNALTITETIEEKTPHAQGQTLLDSDLPIKQSEQSPQLVVTVAGGDSRTYILEKNRISLGRNADNDIVIGSPIVSGHHAALEKAAQGYTLKILPNATNRFYYQGAPIQSELALHDGDILRIGSQDPGMMVTLLYQWPVEAAFKGLSREIRFDEKDQLQIGRDQNCDVVLDAPNVSRYHASLERVGQRYRVRDLKSANGTFVNNQRIEAETWLKPGDTIHIGPYHFTLGDNQLSKFDDTHGLRVEVLGLNKWVRPDLNLLKDISLIFQPREFVVVVGQSGGGKSTLVDAIAGYRPATHGQVLVNDVDIYRHFDAIRSEIGFVPQKDIIHTELTVYQALEYAARLRMPSDTTKAERHERVISVLQDLDLLHRKDVQISGLSGGQQKRVSIGVELLTRPGLFFLDEPSSGLDPGTETALMHLMRHLADQGRTIILITHATKNVMLADKVVFLARGGYLAWFGPPDEALKFFDQYRPERDRRARPMEFDEIYAVLDDPSKGKAEEWAHRYQESTYYQTYIAQPLQALGRTFGKIPPDSKPVSSQVHSTDTQSALKITRTSNRRAISGLRQLAILSSRNLKILTRDRISLFLMLASAPLVAMVDVVLAVILGRDLFAYSDGNMGNALITLFQPAIFAVMVGALAMMREFVKEAEIFRRERLVNLKVLPYVMSKIWVAALLALYQAAAYTVIHYLAFKMPGGVMEFALMYITLVFATLAGMTLGLLASAVAPNANAAPLIVILLIVPQVVLGGALIPVPSIVSAPTSTRWGFEALVSISGAGSDVAADTCWALPEEARNTMSLDDKSDRGCVCMGLNVLNADTCSFPGVGSFYDPVLDEPRPVEPESPSSEDSIAFQKAVTEWEIKRNTAVSKAEALINRFHEDFGWAFVDKDSNQAFWSKILTAWGIQSVIITVMLALILVSIYRKDRI